MIVVNKVPNVLAYHAPNRRTVAGIQEKIVEKGGRNPLSRLANAKNDKETITTWKLDLNRILHVFNVRSIISVRPFLTVHLQTELAMNTHVIVSDLHRNMLKGQERTDGQLWLVSDFRTLSHHRMNKQSPPRHKPGQQSRLPMDPMSYLCI